MKISANAKDLASACALAASIFAATNRLLPNQQVIHLRADKAVTATSVNLDLSVLLEIAAQIDEPGAVALPAERLAALAANFPPDTTVNIINNNGKAYVVGGRGRYVLPIIPIDQLPLPLALDRELGRIELDGEGVRALLRPAFAMSTDRAKNNCLAGLLLHDGITPDGGSALVACATDGRWLACCCVPANGGLSADLNLIVPAATVRLTGKIIAPGAPVTLRRSRTLFAAETPTATLISKLVDGRFPDYSRTVPPPSEAAVSVDRAVLQGALRRMAAASAEPGFAVALDWADAELRLMDGVNHDVIAVEATGAGCASVSARLLGSVLDEVTEKMIRLMGQDPSAPVRIEDGGLLCVLAACQLKGPSS
jgi:DNA polymerase III subunit beta